MKIDQGMQTKSWLAALTRLSGIIFLLWCLNGCGNSSYLTAFISDYHGDHFDEGSGHLIAGGLPQEPMMIPPILGMSICLLPMERC